MIAANAPHSATPRTDPEPWISYSGRRYDAQSYLGLRLFSPRPEYSQNREDYL